MFVVSYVCTISTSLGKAYEIELMSDAIEKVKELMVENGDIRDIPPDEYWMENTACEIDGNIYFIGGFE